MSRRRTSGAAVVALLLTALLTPGARAQADPPVADPIPTPTVSGLGLVLEEMAQLPKSDPVPPATDVRLQQWNRINYLGEMPDGSGRMYVPDLNGKLYLLDKGVQHVYVDVFATIGPDFHSHRGLGSGFGFVAWDPDFKRNGRFYTVHTETGSALVNKKPDLPSDPAAVVHGVISEWTAADPKADTFTGTRREILRVGFASFIHGFQQIGFNPNARRWDSDYGLLYISAGDGGIGVRSNVPQDLAVPQGKILRIDPRGKNGVNGQYGIPRRNPFVGKPGALGEIYAYGMRDPYRFSWDTGGRHRMFMGHIGEKVVESVYEVTPGANFGWSEREGRFRFQKNDPTCQIYPLPADDAKYGYSYPVAGFDHNRPPESRPCSDSGNALIGGFVYRGHKVPELRGKYIYGEGVKGYVLYANEREMRPEKMADTHQLMLYDKSGTRVTLKQLVGKERTDLRFGQDNRGELYILAKANGKIWKVVGTKTFADCRTGHDYVSGATRARDWAPVTPAKWQFPGREVVLAEAGVERPGPRRPFEYAVLKKGPEFGNVKISAEVRLDTPVEISNRDVIIVFGYRSDTEFYYAHLSSDNKIYPHNGIFRVNNADRFRLDDQWDAPHLVGAKPAISDANYHRVTVKHCASSGEIGVYLDGSSVPLMTTVDKTFASGRVGFGSFDNIGRLRNLRVVGEGK